MLSFVMTTVGVSLSGVMAPGPMTASAIEAGSRRPLAGLWMALGHAIVEGPLMAVIALGVGAWLKAPLAKTIIGSVGGAMLILLGVQIFRGLRQAGARQYPRKQMSPLLVGIVMSGGNPYFLFWWATVGLTLTTRAIDYGVWAFVLFGLIHWLCDLVWLLVLSAASYYGVGVVGRRGQQVIQGLCGAAMLYFGGQFLYDVARGMF